jgi:hypothetical protein
MTDPTIMRNNSFKDDYRMFDAPVQIGSANLLDICDNAYNLCFITYQKIRALLPWLANVEYQRQ